MNNQTIFSKMTELSAEICPQEPVEVYLGLGANIGSKYENILAAFDKISTDVLKNAVLSSLYITDPQDVQDQPQFINAACRGSFSGSALKLLKKLNEIEENLGRRRNGIRRGPRLIDIDILLFGEYIIKHGIESDGAGCWLVIPHERLTNRRFALIPMLELNTKLIEPISGLPFSSYPGKLGDQGIYSIDTVRYIKSHGGNR